MIVQSARGCLGRDAAAAVGRSCSHRAAFRHVDEARAPRPFSTVAPLPTASSSSSTRFLALASTAAVAASFAAVYFMSPRSSASCAAISTSNAVSSSPAPLAPSVTETTSMVSTFLRSVVPLSPSPSTAALSLSQLSLLFTPEPSPSSPPPLSYPSYSYTTSPPLIFTASSSPLHQSLEAHLRQTQDVICQHILNIEGGASAFRQDLTQRADGGGIARVLQGGAVFQKAGVNTSFAEMRLPFGKLRDMADDHAEIAQLLARNDWSRRQRAIRGDDSIPVYQDGDSITRFTASLSLVIHSVNPHVPTVHMNYRYFGFALPDGRRLSWFAGGSDLTPAYVRDGDARFFHASLKAVCDRFDPSYYPRWKVWADRYFHIRHRQETRGVGGIFFDDLSATADSAPQYLALLKALSSNFSASYFPLVLRNHPQPFSAAQFHWQQMRRSRYVEFNLMYDKGTSFGLAQPSARPEAILMSLPLTCRFEYKADVRPGSEEEYTLSVLKQPKEWVK